MKNPSAATLFSFPLKARTLGWTDLRLYLFSTLFAVGNLLVPLALTGHIHPILAATAMMASSISVVLNSARKLSLEAKPRNLETV